jgi:hydroxymethylglutaryl-CoA lyase
MNTSLNRDVVLCEVGPRDGLQNTKTFMPTEQKKAWIAAEVACGVHEIEICSFVPAKLIPQFVDAAEIVAFANSIPDLVSTVLVPNLRGFENAIAAGARRVAVPLSASEAHSQSNVRKSREAALADFAAMVAANHARPAHERATIVGAVATAFGCTIQGLVTEADVLFMTERILKAGADELIVADTVGYASPAQIKAIFTKVIETIGPDIPLAAHFHDTRGLGIANALAAYDVGVRHFDATLGGLGGCPYAPGASGNVVMEDLAFAFEAMGVRTGIDLDALIALRRSVFNDMAGLETYGHLGLAGLPKGFEATTAA